MMSAASNFAMNSLWVPSLVFGSQGNLNAFFGLVRLSFYNRPQNVGRGLHVWDMPSCSEDVLEIVVLQKDNFLWTVLMTYLC